MKKTAIISPCGKYRYLLERIWDYQLAILGVILLNPYTADTDQDDPTINKCITLARNWGYGGMKVGNLFALRSTDKKKLNIDSDPVGPENDKYLRQICVQCPQIFCGWGNDGLIKDRHSLVLQLASKNQLFCVSMNKNGTPRHPLYENNESIKIAYNADQV